MVLRGGQKRVATVQKSETAINGEHCEERIRRDLLSQTCAAYLLICRRFASFFAITFRFSP